MSAITWFAIGLVTGGTVAALLGWALSAGANAKLQNAQSKALQDGQKIQSLESALRAEQQNSESLKIEFATLKTGTDKDKAALQGQLAVFDEAESKLKEAFSALASEALRGNTAEFLNLAQAKLSDQQTKATGDLDLRKQAMESLVQPLSETLEKLQAQVQQLEVKREGAYGGIKEQIEMLSGTQKELKAETARLVGALKTPISRGRWGEIQLRRVVELAGMLEHCDFEEQQSYDTAEGKQRPDLIVHLPNGRQIVIDSKVSLAAYMEGMAMEDEAVCAAKMKDHASQIKTHLKQLSSKNYWSALPCTPEFVVAFLPGEVFFSAALQQDPLLIEFGAEQRVILATPTTLIALLKAIAYGWRQEDLAKNAQEINQLGKQLYERLWKLVEQLSELRKRIDGSVIAFDATIGTLNHVLVPARKFHELGAAAGDEIGEIGSIERTTRELPQRKDPMPQFTLKRIAAVAGDEGEK